ncbi:MAG: hypothetical protein ACQET5_13395 [Halobacteriota archaeon]
MATRRGYLLGATSALTTAAGGVGSDDSDNSQTNERNEPTEEPNTAETPSYHFRAAPAEGDDLEAVLSTDEPAVRDLGALVDVVIEVTESFEVVYRSISAKRRRRSKT